MHDFFFNFFFIFRKMLPKKKRKKKKNDLEFCRQTLFRPYMPSNSISSYLSLKNKKNKVSSLFYWCLNWLPKVFTTQIIITKIIYISYYNSICGKNSNIPSFSIIYFYFTGVQKIRWLKKFHQSNLICMVWIRLSTNLDWIEFKQMKMLWVILVHGFT